MIFEATTIIGMEPEMMSFEEFQLTYSKWCSNCVLLKTDTIATPPGLVNETEPDGNEKLSSEPSSSSSSSIITSKPCGTKLTKFITVENPIISADLKKKYKLTFANTGCWSIYYDEENVDAAWDKMIQLYSNGKLKGVQKICRAKKEEKNGDGIPILAFVGPSTDEFICLTAGTSIVKQMNHVIQKCNGDYEQRIYYKLRKHGPVGPGGPNYYFVNY